MYKKKQYKKKLWSEYLDTVEFPQEVKNIAMEIGELFIDDVNFLYTVRKAVLNGGGAIEDEKTHMVYETEGEYHILKHGNLELALRQADMSKLLADMIDIFEDILPLGSVVDLKKDFLSPKIDLSKVEMVRVVIAKRFLGGESGCYYPYAAVIYPIGMGGQNSYICFSSALINKVIHEGYCDALENEFIYQMKKKLVVKEHRKSMGFADATECKEMERILFQNGE